MGRALGANIRMCGKLEPAYGTAPSGNFHQLPLISGDYGLDQPLEANDVIGLGRDPTEPTRGQISVGGQVTIPVDLRAIGWWFASLLGIPTSTGTGPDYVHTYTSGATTLPSLSLEFGHPEVPCYFLSTGVMLDSLKLSWSPQGKASAALQLIAQGEDKAVTSGAGTPTVWPITRVQQFQGSIKKNGQPLGSVTSVEVAIANGMDPVRVIRDDAKIDGVDLGIAAVTGSIAVRFANTDLIDAATDGTPIALQLGWSISATRSLILDLPAVHLPRSKRQVNGPRGIEMRLNWQASKPVATPMLTVTLNNDVTGYTS